jgi:nicotinamidase/pyrazinamidase
MKLAFFDVDTQYDFINKRGKLPVRGAYRIVPNLRKLTNFAAKEHIPIISSADAHLVTDSEFRLFPQHCVQKSAGQRKIRATLLKKNVVIKNKRYTPNTLLRILRNYPQIIIEKQRLDVFTNPNAQSLLRKIEVFCVYGVVTEYCVRAAVEGLLKLRKTVYIVTDAIRHIDRRKANRVLSGFKKRGVRLITTGRLLKSISKTI